MKNVSLALVRVLIVLAMTSLGCASQTPQSDAPDAADASATPPAGEEGTMHNVLTSEEIAQGWQLLFNGESTQGWRHYNGGELRSGVDSGWMAVDGTLSFVPPNGLAEGTEAEGEGSDVVTARSFGSFELSLEFRVAQGSNSGILYLVQEIPGAAIWHNAPEFQVLDDDAWADAEDMDKHFTGDNYDLHAAPEKYGKRAGEWNHARIVINDGHVEHWLNGNKAVEYELWSDAWKELVAASKFAPFPQHGMARSGSIGLQDHGGEVSYRNVKIRPL